MGRSALRRWSNHMIQNRSAVKAPARPNAFGSPDQARDDRGRWAPSGDDAAAVLTGVGQPVDLDNYRGDRYADIQRGTRPDSISANLRPDGKFTAERAALHEKLIDEALAGVPPQENPVSWLMGGGIAGGKSSVLTNPDLGIPQGQEAVQLNFDNFKEGLPEYKQMLEAGDRRAAAYVHAESAMLADEALIRAAENHQPVVLDGTNDTSNEVLARKVETLRENGHAVNAHYVTIPPQVAVDRAMARAEKIGRYIPPAVVQKSHEGVARVVPKAMEEGVFDEVAVWSTEDRTPVKLAEAKGKDVTIHDQAGWDRFKGFGK